MKTFSRYTLSSSKFSGIQQIYENGPFSGKIHVEVTSGNLRVCIVNEEIKTLEDIALNTKVSIDVDKKSYIKIAGESAKFKIVIDLD